MQPNGKDYRKLGGWLLFILVFGVIQILSAFTSLTQYIQLLFRYASYGGLQNMPLYYTLYYAVGIIASILMLLFSIMFIVFLVKRTGNPFKLFFLLYWSLGIILAVFYFVYQLTHPYMNPALAMLPQQLTYRMYSNMDIMELFSTLMVGIYVFQWILYTALLVVWAVYLKRSQRVSVYFSSTAPQAAPVPTGYIPAPGYPPAYPQAPAYQPPQTPQFTGQYQPPAHPGYAPPVYNQPPTYATPTYNQVPADNQAQAPVIPPPQSDNDPPVN